MSEHRDEVTRATLPAPSNPGGGARRLARLRRSVAVLAGPGLALCPGAGIAADAPRRVPLDYGYETTDKGESSVSRIDIWLSVDDDKARRLVFDTGSDRPNTQIGPKASGVRAEGEKKLYLYGAASYGYLVQQVAADTLTFHDPGALEDASAGVTLPVVGQSGYEVARILDIVYTKDNPDAAKLNLSREPVFSQTDASGARTDYYADLDARALIAAGKPADEGGTVSGTFGAGDFMREGYAGTYSIGSTTRTGYVVAANGNSAQETRSATPGCAPCLIVDLDQSLRAQFTSFMPWGEKNPDLQASLGTVDAFPGSGANASIQYEGSYTLGLFAGEEADPVEITGAMGLLDTGTPGGGSLTITETRLRQLIDAGARVTRDASGAYSIAEMTISAPDGEPVAVSDIAVTVVPGDGTGALFVAGQDFFLSQSVMYDLENKATAYTPYFVSADTFTTGAPGAGEVRLTRVTRRMGSVFPSEEADGTKREIGYFGAAGVISGAGELTIAANARLRLSNVNTYTGQTVIEAEGGLELAGIGAIEASSRVVADGEFDISDKGNRTEAWGVSDAHDTARIKSLAGSGRVQLADRRLVLTEAGDRFSGTITDLDDEGAHGGDGLTVAGGVETLTGASTYAGTTRVARDAGLILTGALASPVSVSGLFANHGTVSGVTRVRAGGSASGTGSYGGLEVASGGAVVSGGEGPLRVEGDFTQGSRSRYVFGPVAGGAGIAVSGAATIEAGARLVLDRAVAGTPSLGESYTLLTAEGGISGGYDRLAGDLVTDAPFLAFELAPGETGLALAVERSGTAFAEVADTKNQAAAAAGLDSLGAGNALHDEVVGMTGSEARAGFDLLSGEIHAALPSALMEDSQYTRDALIARLRAASGAVGAGHAPERAAGRMAFAPVPGEQPAAWGQAFGGWGHLDGDGDAARLDRSTGGLLLGADARIALWRVGGMIGFGAGSYDLDDRASSGEARSFHLGAYAGRDWGALALRSGAALSWHRLETDRRVSDEKLTSDYDGHSAQIFGELARRIESGGGAFEPYAGLAYVHVRADGFDETGGAAALSGEEVAMDTTFATLGLRGTRALRLGAAEAVLGGGIGWRHAFGDVAPVAAMAFDGGAAFEVAGAPIAENLGLLELGLDMALSPASALALDYQGQFASGAATNRLAATFTIWF